MQAFEIVPAWTLYPGHGYGLNGPFITGKVRWHPSPSIHAKEWIVNISEKLEVSSVTLYQLSQQILDIGVFLTIFHELDLNHCNPLAQKPTILDRSSGEGYSDYTIAVATQYPDGTASLLQWLAAQSCKGGCGHLTDAQNQQDLDHLGTLKRLYGSIDSGGINNRRIISAARDLGFLVKLLPGGVIQVGTGKFSLWFRSTITNATPSIGVSVAKRKSLTAQYLKARGFLVPFHKVIKSNQVDGALKVAQIIGYPVVVKPDDMDGGVGVHAGIANEAELLECFHLAASTSKNLLIEKHIEGKDYRITVIDGEVVKAIERTPGGVIGDGVHSIKDLVGCRLNECPAGKGSGNQVALDSEAISLLAKFGRTTNDVLPHGVFVPLRRRANMSSGGTSSNVLHLIHPDNIRLAINAAKALKLDIAGIDLISQDIGRSWMDVDTYICEVNAQPQISTEFAKNVYTSLLKNRMGKQIRTRNVLLLSLGDLPFLDDLLDKITTTLEGQGECVACIKKDAIWIQGARYTKQYGDLLRGSHCAEWHSDATALLTALTVDLVLEQGLPWNHIDHLCFIAPQRGSLHELEMLWGKLNQILRQHLVGPIFVHNTDASLFALPSELNSIAEVIDLTQVSWPIRPASS